MRAAWAADAVLFASGVMCLVWAWILRARARDRYEARLYADTVAKLRPPARRKPPPIGFTRVEGGVTIPSENLRRLLNLPESEDPT